MWSSGSINLDWYVVPLLLSRRLKESHGCLFNCAWVKMPQIFKTGLEREGEIRRTLANIASPCCSVWRHGSNRQHKYVTRCQYLSLPPHCCWEHIYNQLDTAEEWLKQEYSSSMEVPYHKSEISYHLRLEYRYLGSWATQSLLVVVGKSAIR